MLTLRDLKVMSSQEMESSKKDNHNEAKQNEENNTSCYRDPSQIMD